eukprot:4551581-Ditylum_brightwellii.AAC.1
MEPEGRSCSEHGIHTDFVKPITDLIRHDSKYICTIHDGGATGGLGYCRWIVATGTRILVKGYGHAPGQGHQMESL